ncbi:MAG: hypothetical protein KAS63_08840, partial [Candidatus Heimdallarchaeota archaeon]|nr:hypothetical protein [Candidatus Heimdallarchaeota archaeon]MCK4955454.1 hypothetical protein [Candidatus Heimdallarchaeota archaeon]
QLTEQFWWMLFFLGIGILGGFSLGSVSRVFKSEEKNAYLVMTGFMLAALILFTVYLAIWQRNLPALNSELSGIAVIMIAAASGLLSFIGTTLMSIGGRIR